MIKRNNEYICTSSKTKDTLSSFLEEITKLGFEYIITEEEYMEDETVNYTVRVL